MAYYIFAPTASARQRKAKFKGYFINRKNPYNYQRLKLEITALHKDLSIAAKRYGYLLDRNVCRGASGTLKHLLNSHLSIEAIVVHNENHTFLLVANYFGKGQHLYIDPTYKQFLKPDLLPAKIPPILIGSYIEILEILNRFGGEKYAHSYFRNLLMDASAPNWLSRNYPVYRKAQETAANL